MAIVRRVLIAVDDTDDDVKMVEWTVGNFLRFTDEVHLMHVVPRATYAAQYGAPPIDMMLPQDDKSYEALLDMARQFIETKFLPLLFLESDPVVHLVKSELDNDAIGHVICQKASQLEPSAVVLAKHQRGRMQELFVGSVCKYCVARCQYPVVVVHGHA